MAFEFKKKESVRKAVQRLGRKRIEKALEKLKRCRRLDAVHEVRKEIKQLRALLRLVRGAMPGTKYRQYTATLREAAGHLAAARDAQVKVSALAGLVAQFKGELPPGSFGQIKAILTANCREQQADLSRTEAPIKVARLLNHVARRFGSFKLEESGWNAIEPGIRRSYRDGRRAYHRADQTRTPGQFHEWRKRVKDLLYQAKSLGRIWPEQMHAVQAELKQLGEWIGDDHDFFLLTEPAAMKKFTQEAPHEAAALKALVDKRQEDLRAQALALGARFYEGKPAAFCQRLREYWKRWRREPKGLLRAR